MKDKVMTIVVVVIIGIFITNIISMIQKNNATSKQENQIKLEECVENAKEVREDLWNSNCKEQFNGSCTINSESTVNWIEERYEQELNNCYKLYD